MGRNYQNNSEKKSANSLLIVAAAVIIVLILVVCAILLYRLFPKKKQVPGKQNTGKEKITSSEKEEKREDYTKSTSHENGLPKEKDDQSEAIEEDDGYIESESDSEGLPLDVEAERQRIVEIYDSINGSKLKKIKGYPSYLTQSNSFLTTDDNVTAYLDEDGQLRKIKTKDEDLDLQFEIYHQSIEDAGKDIELIYPDDTAVFTFAVTSSGKEYRLYFKDNKVIRYIGSDGVKHDFPRPYNYSEILSVNELAQDQEIIRTMLNYTSPGWWVAFEGE